MRFPRLCLVALAAGFGVTVEVAAQSLERLRKPQNSALSLPLGQGLDFVHSAEPLGKSRFRLRALNRSQDIVHPTLGAGSAYTGLYGIGYGVSDGMDVTFQLPFFLDSAGGLNKFGTGDPVVGIKWARPARLPAAVYKGFQILIGLPLGFKEEVALDRDGGVRPFSNGALDVGLQMLLDMHLQRLSLFFNGGLFRSGNADVLTQLVYSVGVEFGRTSRWASFNAEYQARVSVAAQSRAAGVLKIGTRIHLFRGVELELNREFGFNDHPVDQATTFGIRTHGFLTGLRRLESHIAIYQPPPKPKRLYEPEQVLRIGILDFAGFESYGAGHRLVEKVKSKLAPHDSLEIVDLASFKGVERGATLSPMEVLDLGRKAGVDVVVTGTVSDYDVDRFSGLKIPFLLELPETEVKVSLRYRVMWFTGPARLEMEAYNQQVWGRGVIRKRPRLLPADRRDITVQRLSAEIEGVHEAALDDLVGNLLASMATQFSWVPPEFDARF